MDIAGFRISCAGPSFAFGRSWGYAVTISVSNYYLILRMIELVRLLTGGDPGALSGVVLN